MRKTEMEKDAEDIIRTEAWSHASSSPLNDANAPSWQVHKFGGTSVASAECFRNVATILQSQLLLCDHDSQQQSTAMRLAVVVSAMGGKPKVTDLLVQAVQAAASRDEITVEERLNGIWTKHESCVKDLFGSNTDQYSRLTKIMQGDLQQIRDILKTVSLMKWQARRIAELVSGYGEVWSTQILTALLQEQTKDHAFLYLDARTGVITIEEDEGGMKNNNSYSGTVEWKKSHEMLEHLYHEELSKLNHDRHSMLHVVMTGYVACNTEGVATTLQRDGSDYSAAILGRLLQATMVSIWTDVDGVLTADPRRVPHAHAVPCISYNEAMELAYFGAKVIHPKTMQPCLMKEPFIPIYIRNSFRPELPGSRISTLSTTTGYDDNNSNINRAPELCVCGFSSIEGMALINVEGSGLIGVHGVAKRLFGTLETLGVNVVLISQASSEHSITFCIHQREATMAQSALQEEFAKELTQTRISNIDIQSADCSILAAVGDGMSHMAGVCGRFFSALGDAKINVLAISQGCSERNISAVVQSCHSTRALRALHGAFRLSHTTVRVGLIVGLSSTENNCTTSLGESLLRLLEGQRNQIRTTFEIDLQVCAVAVLQPPEEQARGHLFLTLKEESEENQEASITMADVEDARCPNDESSKKITFVPSTSSATSPGIQHASGPDFDGFLQRFVKDDAAHQVIFDCTNDPSVSRHHAKWLSEGVHVVTANNTGMSGSKEQRDAIARAESSFNQNGSKSSSSGAKYLREVTVGGGLPVISTVRSLLNSGDKIRRIDGIFSVSMSYILYRMSPPPKSTMNGTFDEELTGGAFKGDIPLPGGSSLESPCGFQQAIQEAVALDLMEKDPSHDLNNEYSARVMMILAKELGLDSNRLSLDDIQKRSDPFLVGGDQQQIEDRLSQRVAAASARGCVVRHIASIDVASQTIDIRLVDVPNSHVFAINPPSSECVRLFTHRYHAYPLVVQGPAAGDDCTSSALLAEVLSMMSQTIGPTSGVLSRSDSSAHLT